MLEWRYGPCDGKKGRKGIVWGYLGIMLCAIGRATVLRSCVRVIAVLYIYICIYIYTTQEPSGGEHQSINIINRARGANRDVKRGGEREIQIEKSVCSDKDIRLRYI